jgi:D-glycero-D-manno-heptose 1,7-bisphosphate phosphatase
MTLSARPFVLLDRDGTLNVERDYLSHPDEMELLPGVPAALARLRALGFGLVVITNQSGIGRGYFSLDTVELIHQRLRELLAEQGAEIDAIYLCPHAPDESCDCRKPLTGMVDQAVAEWGFDPRQAFLVGDKEADIDLGRALGARTILVRTGWGRDTERAGHCAPDIIVDDLPAAVAWIEGQQAGESGR